MIKTKKEENPSVTLPLPSKYWSVFPVCGGSVMFLRFVTPWNAALQAPLSMGFSRQEYWSGLPFLSPRDLPHPGIKPASRALQEDSLPAKLPGNSVFPAAAAAAAAAAKSLQSCPTLHEPIDGSPPGSPVPGILQARTLEWVAISFSNA